MINVSMLKQGIVIDHIKVNHGYEVFKQLKLDEIDDVIVLMRNIPSHKMGRKDIIKIETDLKLDLTILGLIDPNITVSYIKDGKRIKKVQPKLPEVVEGILKCKNPRCITQYEKVENIKFYLANAEKREYRCSYCDSKTTLVEHK
ncbi:MULTISPECIES: aspartate carbamoyltransferase regulatory subunit [Anaerofustis]|uniref:aspartate carbamoyltransferase regulatory subunit n=1 Tax=Anaerofustis TaxID=264995 RepID=UPI001107249E|nr:MULTISPECIES: aspartate carbamoyltransferase regulatory subunit [Anaerofustis]MCO8194651.1 aspartate carbamoyltransferase regulatory subunit [Anaerofustis sp. NSJ-163]